MTPTFRPVGDSAVLVIFAAEISDEVNRTVLALDHAIAKASIPGLCEVVPAVVNLLVVFDPLETDHTGIEQAILSLMPLPDDVDMTARVHRVPVCYDADFAPDLAQVAKTCGLSEEAVINAHLAGEYRVYMYGFAPGYAYMAQVPEAIRVPRKPAALRDVPAGSILIAGPQCLITTLTMPTGWSIIGRSAKRILLDDPERPFLFDVGDRIVFDRIDRATFERDGQVAAHA